MGGARCGRASSGDARQAHGPGRGHEDQTRVQHQLEALVKMPGGTAELPALPGVPTLPTCLWSHSGSQRPGPTWSEPGQGLSPGCDRVLGREETRCLQGTSGHGRQVGGGFLWFSLTQPQGKRVPPPTRKGSKAGWAPAGSRLSVGNLPTLCSEGGADWPTAMQPRLLPRLFSSWPLALVRS